MKLMLCVGCVIGTMSLSACMAMAPSRPIEQMSYVPPQVCSCQPQCEAMWAEAMQDLPSLTGMRIRIATDAMAETYVASDAGRMTGTVNKVPAGDGTYKIEASFNPWVSTTNLNTLAYNGERLLYTHLRSVKEGNPCKSANVSG